MFVPGATPVASYELPAFNTTASTVWPPQMQLLIDWNQDGSFGGPYDDVTAYLLEITDLTMGRNKANPFAGLADPSTFAAVLDNRSGIFSQFNISSPIYGDANPGRLVRWQCVAPTASVRFTGDLYTVDLDFIGAVPVAKIVAKGPSFSIAEAKANPPASAGALTGTLLNAVLDDIGFSATRRNIDAGATTTSRWYIADKPFLQAGRDLEATEGGFLFDDHMGRIAFQDRNYRQTGARLISQVEYTDAPGSTYMYLQGFQQLNPVQFIFNEALIKVPSFLVRAPAILWTFQGTPPTLAAGQSLSFFANYPNPNSEAGAAYVFPWTDPRVGTDIIQTGVADSDIGLTFFKFPTAMKMTITNNNVSSGCTLTTLQARGVAIVSADATTVSSEDAASQAAFQKRTYNNPAPWMPDISVAQDQVDALVLIAKDPHPAFDVPFLANMTPAMWGELMNRRISDRVTFTAQQTRSAANVSADCFVEYISERYDVQNNRYEINLGLSAAVAGDFWILGTSVLDTSTILGY